jgi:hypothetical protein
MDAALKKCLRILDDQIHKLSIKEHEYLFQSAQKDILYSELFREATGKSVADRQAEVYSHPRWLDFMTTLTTSHVEFNEERRTYEIFLKAFDAEYLSLKIDSAAIKRQV